MFGGGGNNSHCFLWLQVHDLNNTNIPEGTYIAIVCTVVVVYFTLQYSQQPTKLSLEKNNTSFEVLNPPIQILDR